MKAVLSKVLSYSVVEIINKSIPFLLLPILTRYLSPEGYGSVVFYQATWQLIVVLMGFGLTSYISVSYCQDSIRVFSYNRSQIISFSLTASLIILFICLVFSVSGFIDIIWLVVFSSAAVMALVNFSLAYYQASKNSRMFGICQISITLVNLFLSLLLVVTFKLDFEGRVLGFCIAPLIAFIVCIYKEVIPVKDLRVFKFKTSNLRSYFPLVIHQVANWSRYSLDKYIILMFLGAASLGEYNVTFQLAFILSVIVMVVNRATQPFLFESLKNEVSIRYLVAIQVVVAIVFLVLVGFSVLSFSELILGGEFALNNDVFVILLLSFLIQGIYLSICNILYYYKRNKEISLNSTVCLFVTVILSLFSVPSFGLLGAAVSILVSMTLLLFLTIRNVLLVKEKIKW